jgi:hypothetical protein
MLTIPSIETTLNQLLQRSLSFSVNGKIVKQGKLILFSIKDYHITFFIRVNGTQKKYEIPYPFSVKNSKTKHGKYSVVFDYTAETLAQINGDLLFKLKNISSKPSKLFNNKLTILEEK